MNNPSGSLQYYFLISCFHTFSRFVGLNGLMTIVSLLLVLVIKE
jgi:hypothetical protein